MCKVALILYWEGDSKNNIAQGPLLSYGRHCFMDVDWLSNLTILALMVGIEPAQRTLWTDDLHAPRIRIFSLFLAFADTGAMRSFGPSLSVIQIQTYLLIICRNISNEPLFLQYKFKRIQLVIAIVIVIIPKEPGPIF